MTRVCSLALLLAVPGLLVTGPVPAATSEAAPTSVRYVGNGIEAGVVCSPDGGIAVNGGCLPFGAGTAVLVEDAIAGRAVWFDVCVDNDGDGVCVEPQPWNTRPCSDDVVSSRIWDDGVVSFANPLGPLPAGFRPGCPGGPFAGYVVFVCSTTQTVQGAAGTVSLVAGAQGTGNAGCLWRPYRYTVDGRGSVPVQAAADGSFTGLPCTFAGSNDPTGLINQRRGPEQPVVTFVTAGPWHVPGATRVSVTCAMEWDPEPGGERNAWSTNTTPGPVGVLAGSPYVFFLGYQWLCTYVSWTAADGTVRHFARDRDGNAYATATGPGGMCVFAST